MRQNTVGGKAMEWAVVKLGTAKAVANKRDKEIIGAAISVLTTTNAFEEWQEYVKYCDGKKS